MRWTLILWKKHLDKAPYNISYTIEWSNPFNFLQLPVISWTCQRKRATSCNSASIPPRLVRTMKEFSSLSKEFEVLTNSTFFPSCNTIKREKATVIREIETEAWLFSTDFMFNYVLFLLWFYYADTKSWGQPKNLKNKLLQKTKEAHHLHQKKCTNRKGKSKG